LPRLVGRGQGGVSNNNTVRPIVIRVHFYYHRSFTFCTVLSWKRWLMIHNWGCQSHIRGKICLCTVNEWTSEMGLGHFEIEALEVLYSKYLVDGANFLYVKLNDVCHFFDQPVCHLGWSRMKSKSLWLQEQLFIRSLLQELTLPFANSDSFLRLF
jgi:hypothetical protein